MVVHPVPSRLEAGVLPWTDSGASSFPLTQVSPSDWAAGSAAGTSGPASASDAADSYPAAHQAAAFSPGSLVSCAAMDPTALSGADYAAAAVATAGSVALGPRLGFAACDPW